MLDLVRDGLRGQVALAAQYVASADEQLDAGRCPERYQDPLRCSDALRALFDEVGWSTHPSDPEIDPKIDPKIDPPSDLKVDLGTHAWALIEALGDQISDHTDKLRDNVGDDEWDKERRDILTREMSALSSLAVIVLLRIHAQLLRPTAPPWTGMDPMR